MKAAELAEELAEFWYSAIARADWDERLRILREVDSQLLADLEKRSDYEAVWPRFVAAVVERLGAPPVSEEAQAKIYATSGNEGHQEAARAWFAQGGAAPAPVDSVAPRSDRRRFPRQPVDGMSEIWVWGRASSCRLVDLSAGGARVRATGVDAAPGTPVRLALPGSGLRDATVVFRNDLGIGLEFSDRPAAA